VKLWDLPEGWAWKTFGEVANVDSNLVDPADHSHLPHIAPNHIESGTGQLLPYKTVAEDGVTSSKHLFRPGHILYSKIRPYLAKAVMVDFAGLCSADMYPVSTSMEAEFLHRWLISSTFTAQASQSQGRTVLPKINKKALGVLKVPVPPREDQRRIVARIESLQARSRRAKEALDAIPPLLERFRQSVLAAAFRGDLTADWRKKNPDVEPASVLLERIRAERKRRWIDAETEKARSKAEAKAQKAGKPWTEAHDRKALEAGRKRAEKRYKEPEPVDPEGLPELPEGWCWGSAEEVVEPLALIIYGIVQPGREVEGGVPYVRGKDIVEGEILVDQLRRTSLEIATRYARASLEPGDGLLGIIRATKVARVPAELRGGNITQGTARFRPSLAITSEYMALWLDSPWAQSWLHAHYRGIDMPGLNLRDVRRLPMPLAPLGEQAEVASIAAEYLGRIRVLRRGASAARKRADSFDQSVLAKAFRGELTGANSTDG